MDARDVPEPWCEPMVTVLTTSCARRDQTRWMLDITTEGAPIHLTVTQARELEMNTGAGKRKKKTMQYDTIEV